jgi:hypothetical protein
VIIAIFILSSWITWSVCIEKTQGKYETDPDLTHVIASILDQGQGRDQGHVAEAETDTVSR